GTMQHHHTIAGEHLKQAKCSSRQKAQAGKSTSRHILPCNMQHGTMQQTGRNQGTCNMKNGTMKHHKIKTDKHHKKEKRSTRQKNKQKHQTMQNATWYHATCNMVRGSMQHAT